MEAQAAARTPKTIGTQEPIFVREADLEFQTILIAQRARATSLTAA